MNEAFVWAIVYAVFSIGCLLVVKHDRRIRLYDGNFVAGVATVALLVSWGMIFVGARL